jgi:phosphoglycolate phosphatase
MKPEAVLLDLDGTLVDSTRDIVASVQHALRELDAPVPAAEVLRAYMGYPLEPLFAAVRPGGTTAECGRFIELYRAHYREHELDTTRPFPGVAETLTRLRPARLAVVTAKLEPTAERLLRALGLLGLVDAVVGSSALPPKPDPASVRAALARLGVASVRAVLVGDTDRDLLAARAAGVRAVAVTYGGWSAARLRALGPDALLERFADLPDVLAML